MTTSVFPTSEPAGKPAEGPHQPADLVPADLGALAAERPPELARAVHRVVGAVDAADVGLAFLIPEGTNRGWPGTGGVVARWGDLQGLADRLDPEADALLVDEGGHLATSGGRDPPRRKPR